MRIPAQLALDIIKASSRPIIFETGIVDPSLESALLTANREELVRVSLKISMI